MFNCSIGSDNTIPDNSSCDSLQDFTASHSLGANKTLQDMEVMSHEELIYGPQHSAHAPLVSLSHVDNLKRDQFST
jgi:hypothetical protein